MIHRWDSEEGLAQVRTYPCCCVSCLAEDYTQCNRKRQVGRFKDRQQTALGLRLPASRYTSVEDLLPEEYEVREILARRQYGGVEQYLVSWSDFSETTWVAADRLNCIDLLEAFESQNK